MKQHVRFKNVSGASHARFEEWVRELADKHLEAHLTHLNDDMKQLFAVIEKNRHHDFYRVSLRLHVPRDVLLAREDDYDARLALRHAFEELERRVERYLRRLRRDDAWRRKGRRQQLERLKHEAGTATVAQRRAFGELVRPHLGALEAFVRRELTYLQALGDLVPDEPGVLDVVDETLARAAAQFTTRPTHLNLDDWLRRLAREVLDAQVAAARTAAGEMLSLEHRPPRDTLAPPSDEEIFEFYQPDEVLRVEDLVPAPEGADPEVAAERRELQTRLYRWLGVLPTAWRRALMLHVVDGLPVAAVAAILGASEAEVGDWIARADEFLRTHLVETGVVVAPGAPAGDYLQKAPATAASEEVVALLEAYVAAA